MATGAAWWACMEEPGNEANCSVFRETWGTTTDISSIYILNTVIIYKETPSNVHMNPQLRVRCFLKNNHGNVGGSLLAQMQLKLYITESHIITMYLLLPPEIPTVLNSSAGIASTDWDVEPLLVLPSGEEAMLFAVVVGDPCPTVQWRLNGTGISNCPVCVNSHHSWCWYLSVNAMSIRVYTL